MDALSIESLQYKHSLRLRLSFVDAIIIIPSQPPRSEAEPRPRLDRAGGENAAETAVPGPACAHK